MPVHDWKRADVGLFHHFHQSWIGELCDTLNAGLLPLSLFALIEKTRGVKSDGLTGSTSQLELTDEETYAALANRIGVWNKLGELTVIVEIASPGNKDRVHSRRKFVEKTLDFLSQGIHVLVLDLFPPTARDPNGIHRAIWDEVRDDDYTPPPDKPLTLASYVGEPSYTAYVEAAAVDQPLPAMPFFSTKILMYGHRSKKPICEPGRSARARCASLS